MSKRVFRPFWSLDIIETENFLCEMSAKGYHLKEIKAVTKVFVFEKGKMEEIQYKVCHHKTGVNCDSQSLVKSGWCNVLKKKKWTILANANDKSQIKIHPPRESLLNRNRIIKYSLGSILLMWFIMSIMPMIFLMELLFNFNSSSLNITYMPGAKLSMIIILLVLILLVYIMIKLNKSDKKLRMGRGTDVSLSAAVTKYTIIDYKLERKLRKHGQVIKKIKLGFIYSPDRTEKWLEGMEKKGYNLYRVSGTGNSYYFMKGKPKNVKYSLDFQTTVNDSYFEIHKSNGWEMMFTNFSSFAKHTLWEKEYSAEKPALYSDTSNIIRHARKQCMVYCILFTPIFIMYVLIMGSNISMYLKGKQVTSQKLIMLIVFFLFIVELGYFIMKSLGYYLRCKKKFS
jgi:uncharacterized membrane protein